MNSQTVALTFLFSHSQIVRRRRSEKWAQEVDTLFRGRDGDHLLRCDVRVRPGSPRGRDHGEINLEFESRMARFRCVIEDYATKFDESFDAYELRSDCLESAGLMWIHFCKEYTQTDRWYPRGRTTVTINLLTRVVSWYLIILAAIITEILLGNILHKF